MEEQFEGDYSFKINLAPQVLNKRDRTTGRAKKWEVPSSVAMPAFRALTKARRLRGTPFDVFGRTAHRRAERGRINDYEELMSEILASLTPQNHPIAVQLASLPDSIRGYDMVKDETSAQAKEKEITLLTEFRA
jgi:indolepyruvate ferredoxin oxidoreductase